MLWPNKAFLSSSPIGGADLCSRFLYLRCPQLPGFLPIDGKKKTTNKRKQSNWLATTRDDGLREFHTAFTFLLRSTGSDSGQPTTSLMCRKKRRTPRAIKSSWRRDQENRELMETKQFPLNNATLFSLSPFLSFLYKYKYKWGHGKGSSKSCSTSSSSSSHVKNAGWKELGVVIWPAWHVCWSYYPKLRERGNSGSPQKARSQVWESFLLSTQIDTTQSLHYVMDVVRWERTGRTFLRPEFCSAFWRNKTCLTGTSHKSPTYI